MENHLPHKSSNVPFKSNRSGCMWGIFHFVDFYQRFYTRIALPDKKHEGGRQVGGIKIPGEASEGRDFTDGEVDSHLIQDKKIETSPTSKKSGKTPIKILIAEEMSKEHEQKCQNQAFPARLLCTDPIHHLEHTDYNSNEKSAVCENPKLELHSHETGTCNSRNHDPFLPKYPEEQIIFNKRCEMCGTMNRSTDYLNPDKLEEKLDQAKKAFLKLKHRNGKGLGSDAPLHPSKEFVNALDVLNENRELFLKVLQDPNSILAKRYNSSPESATEFSGRRAVNLIKLKQKQKEIQSYAKQKRKVRSETPTTIPIIIESSEDGHSESLPLGAIEIADVGTSLESVSDSPHELINQKENKIVRNHFKYIKKRIKHAIKESKNERLRISMDGFLHRIPYGRRASKNAKSDADRDGKDSPRSGYNSDSGTSASAKDAPTQIRRAPSLTASLDRYSQLLESILSRDSKRPLSERLKLANEDGSVQDRSSSRTFLRILSTPEFGSYVFGRDVDGDAPRDMLYRRTPSGILADGNASVKSYSPDNQKPVDTLINTEKCTQLDSFVETDSQENYMENISGPIVGNQERLVLDTDGNGNDEWGGIGDKLEDLAVGEKRDSLLDGQETGLAKNASDKLSQASPLSILNSCIPEGIMCPEEVSIPEVSSEVKPRHMDFNELDHYANLHEQSSVDAPDNLETIGNVAEVQTLSTHADSNSLHVQVGRKDEADFNYVRDVLKKSGFSGDELLGKWYSHDQPVDPLLFDEVECSSHKFHITRTEACSSCDHQLLFDLINEVLLEIYERSFTYCPWHLCFNSNTRPMPMGYHVLEEVWASISWHLSSQPQSDPSTRDLAKGDGWMHLQPEAECVGLELEDWIVDNLLDEVTLELAST